MKSFYTNVTTYGNKILFRGIVDGKRVNQKLTYSPSIFVPSPQPSEFKSLDGANLQEMKFDTMRDAKDFVARYDDIDNFKMYGNTRWEYPFIAKEYPDLIDWDIDYINIANIDIEVDSNGGFATYENPYQPITAIAMEIKGKMYVFGVPPKEWEDKYRVSNPDVVYYEFKDEISLLKKFMAVWSQDYPDLITGWYIKFFDIPYLIARMTKLLGEAFAKKISPWNYFYKRNVKTKFGTDQVAYVISGVATFDYMELFKKFHPEGAKQESYSLDDIAFFVLERRKLSYGEYDNLNQLYRENYCKFIDYNLEDMVLIRDMNAKLKLIEVGLTLAYDAKVNFEDVFTQVRQWTVMIHNELMKTNIVGPHKRESYDSEEFEGAFVKEPKPGRYQWVAGFDLKGLYPHITWQCNISPEMIVEPEFYTQAMKDIIMAGVSIEKLLAQEIDTSKLEGVCLTPNGQFFYTDRGQGFLGHMMQTVIEGRDIYKNKMKDAKKEKEKLISQGITELTDVEKAISRFDNLQQTKKINANSAYGALGNVYFFLYDTRQAEGITSYGKLAVQWVARDINAFINKAVGTKDIDYVIASDTDSCYLNFAAIVGKSFPNEGKGVETSKIIDFMDKICNDFITPVIERSFEQLARYTHAYQQKMEMKREPLADVGIWTAKKRYVLNVWDNESVRFAKPKIKITGLQAIASSTPRSVREKIKEAIKIMLNGTNDELLDFIEDYRKVFPTLPPEDIASHSQVNGHSADSLAKGTTFQVYGAVWYNRLIKQKGLEGVYEKIKEGEKCKFLYLKQPNPIQSHVIAFIRRLPKEFDLHKYIDYDTQFDKRFLQPLKTILDCIGWKIEDTESFDDFWIKK